MIKHQDRVVLAGEGGVRVIREGMPLDGKHLFRNEAAQKYFDKLRGDSDLDDYGLIDGDRNKLYFRYLNGVVKEYTRRQFLKEAKDEEEFREDYENRMEVYEREKIINNITKKNIKKFVVYYNDGVNEMVDMFQSDSQEECERWIANDTKGRTLVDDDHNCSESVFYSSKVFRYEVYEMPYIEEIDGEDVFHDPVYASDYYYAD